jgi:DNA-binding transcriptional LysR family regulator
MTYILPPLNALRAFEAAARHLSFKLAAHELHVTPAAVGQQVKALEARLGVRLFERLHKQLVLTEAGQAYLPEISASICAAWNWRRFAPPMPKSACGCCSPLACTSWSRARSMC